VEISKVKTAKRIGEFVLRDDDSPNLIKVVYDPNIPKNELESPDPRVYIFTSNGVIKKIGGSESKGGIKSTLSFYENARTGSPGPSRFITHGLIARELQKGHRVEIYLITSPRVRARICGLFDCSHETDIAAFKEMESRCLEDFKLVEGRYPDWNFQENHETYPHDLYQEYLRYHNKRTSRS